MGWVGVGAVTIAYDAWAIRRIKRQVPSKTMSTVAREHPLLTIVGLVALGVHLLG